MIRVKIVKAHKNHKVGDTVSLSKNEAFGLIDGGFAIVAKDLTSSLDYKTKVNHGRPTKLRPRGRSKR